MKLFGSKIWVITKCAIQQLDYTLLYVPVYVVDESKAEGLRNNEDKFFCIAKMTCTGCKACVRMSGLV